MEQTIKWDDYQAAANATAIYPGAGTTKGVDYAVHGLCGESSELLQTCAYGEAADMVKEAGDVLWYVAQCSGNLSLPMPALPDRGQLGTAPDWDLRDFAAEVCINVGRVAEHAKKTLRDDEGKYTFERIAAISDQLDHVVFFLADLVHHLGHDLESVAGANIAKLADRKSRGVLRGEGDNR